ncbi:MAG TPA: MCE family protein [Acidimicrobiales bacterium]|nr:MCE family protein [Acidimicrobiales bacterium]
MTGVAILGRPRASRLGRWAAGLAIAVACGLLSSCGVGAGQQVTASAAFSDVSDLAVGAPVQMADINIGSVKSITLDGNQARVEISVSSSARVPANVTAEVRRTTVLGERFIELVPDPGTTDHSPLLADGATIAHTRVVPELEQLVKGGAQVFGPISANQLAVLVQAGGQGFGGEGAQLHQLLASFSDITAGYAGQTDTIRALVSSLDQLGSATGPDAQAGAEAVSNLARTTTILAQQSDRFNQLLASLNNLSLQGRSLLESYLPQMNDQLTGLADATNAVAARQQDLALLVTYLQGHNRAAAQATFDRFVQVLDDLVICGLPNGGDDPTSQAGACTPPPGGTP